MRAGNSVVDTDFGAAQRRARTIVHTLIGRVDRWRLRLACGKAPSTCRELHNWPPFVVVVYTVPVLRFPVPTAQQHLQQAPAYLLGHEDEENAVGKRLAGVASAL